MQQSAERFGNQLGFEFAKNIDCRYRADYESLANHLNQLAVKNEIEPFKKLVRALCQYDLFFLLYFVCGIKPVNHPWVLERIYEVQGLRNRTVDLWAREHFKSTIITFGLTLQDILRNPEERIGIFSHKMTIAVGFAHRIMRELETNQLLHFCFDDILWGSHIPQEIMWSKENGFVIKRSGNYFEATVEPCGLIDGMPTGKHYTVRVYDDIITERSVTTPDMMDKAEEAFRLSHNLGARGGQVRIVGTIYQFGDIHHRLSKDRSWNVRVYSAEDEEGHGVMMTASELETKRSDYGDWVYSTQMLLNPIQLSEMRMKAEWFKTHKGIPSSTLTINNRYVVVDPSRTKGKKSDFTVMWVFEKDPRGNYIVLDGIRDKLSPSQRWMALTSLMRRWNNVRSVGYAKTGFEDDIFYFEEKMREEGFFFNVIPLKEAGDKIKRIGNILQPLFKEGRIWFPEYLWYDTVDGLRINITEAFMREEYLAYPSPEHDDMLDALCLMRHKDFPVSSRRLSEERREELPLWNPLENMRKERQRSWMTM